MGRLEAGLASVDRHLENGDVYCGNGGQLGKDRRAPAMVHPDRTIGVHCPLIRITAGSIRQQPANGCGERNALSPDGS